MLLQTQGACCVRGMPCGPAGPGFSGGVASAVRHRGRARWTARGKPAGQGKRRHDGRHAGYRPGKRDGPDGPVPRRPGRRVEDPARRGRGGHRQDRHAAPRRRAGGRARIPVADGRAARGGAATGVRGAGRLARAGSPAARNWATCPPPRATPPGTHGRGSCRSTSSSSPRRPGRRGPGTFRAGTSASSTRVPEPGGRLHQGRPPDGPGRPAAVLVVDADRVPERG